MKIRAKNISDQKIAEIVGILDGWSGKLTWDVLIAVIESKGLGLYTRQALDKHTRIATAFSVTKKRLASAKQSKKGDGEQVSPELGAALQRVARLEAENARLTAENHQLLEQFARWAYNAHIRGLDKEFLSQPLPAVDRERSRKKAYSHGA